jgi:DNA polymerase-3 subunit epsilon
MRVLVFDTETTGLPETKIINPDTLNKWPYIVQFSYIIYDTDLNEIVEVKDFIVKVPIDVIISQESVNLHGITNEISAVKGITIEEVFNEFFFSFKNSDKIVGHNISFDINMIKIELLRIIYFNRTNISNEEIKLCKWNLHYLTNFKNISCTLQDSIELCNIKAVNKFGKTYLKYPKLIELHQKLFETTPNNLHNSLNDILVTLRCFMMLQNGDDLNKTCNNFKNVAQNMHLF